MITIRTQSEFANAIANTSTNEMIRIYPNIDGLPYELNSSWQLTNNVYIHGVANPKIKYTGSGGSAINVTSTTIIENVKIKGLTIIGNSGTQSNGIYIENCGSSVKAGNRDSSVKGPSIDNRNGIKIEKCVIHSFNGSGISTKNMYNSTIKNVEIYNCTGIGINGINTCLNNIFVNNKIHHNSDNGIQLGYGCSQNIINENHIIQNSLAGIILNMAECNMIVGNTITSNLEDGIYILSDSDRNIISGNDVSHQTWGFYCEESSYNIITGNQLNSNSASGIELDVSDLNIVIGNSLDDSNNGIVALNGSQNNTITGNTSAGNNNLDIFLHEGTSGILYSDVYGSIINAGSYISDSEDEQPGNGTLEVPIFKEGIEYSKIVSGTSGRQGIGTNASIKKYDNYYELLAYGSTIKREAIVTTEDPIDVTEITKIAIEFEIEGNIDTGEAIISLENFSLSLGLGLSGYTADISQSLTTNGQPPTRITYLLDVSEAYGLVYPRISLNSLSSSSVDNIAKLRVYSITMY